jgi:hypothetical protein
MANYTGFDLVFRTTSLEAATQMGLSPIFSTSANEKGFALLFDAMLFTDLKEIKVLPSGYRYAVCEGSGIRLAMKMTDIKGEVHLNFAAIAAQTKLQLASTEYKVQGFGVSDQVVETFLDVPLDGSLDDKAFSALRRALSQTLPDFFEKNPPGSSTFTVPLPSINDSPAARARTIYYVMTRIARRAGLQDAIKERPPGVSPEMITITYAQLLGSIDSSQNVKPSQEQAESAGRWLVTGTRDW